MKHPVKLVFYVIQSFINMFDGSIYVSSCFSIEKVLLVDGLKHNLLSVSQLCDKCFIVCFHNNKCTLTLKNDISLEGFRVDNIYKINLDRVDTKTEICLKTTLDESWLWHRRLCHARMHTLRKIDPQIDEGGQGHQAD